MARAPDLLARAYATLDLSPGCSRREAARQYKRLAKRWHPDRYANDPQGQVEAALRMREINRAFSIVLQAQARHSGLTRDDASAAVSGQPPTEARERYFGQRLSQVELDAIVESIGTPGYFSTLMRYGVWGGSFVWSYLLILQPGSRPRNALNFLGGMLLATGMAGHLIYTLWRKKR